MIFDRIKKLDGSKREKEIIKIILEDNLYPGHILKFKPIKIDNITIYVALDYFCIGTENDYIRIPAFPSTAQIIADHFNCLLPTEKIVNAIYSAGDIILEPITYRRKNPSDPAMTSSESFKINNDKIQTTIDALNIRDAKEKLIVGHKKDIVIANELNHHKDKVAIYGWHQKSKKGKPIQGLNAVDHSNHYVDYSHGIRLISNKCLLNDNEVMLEDLLKDKLYSQTLLNSNNPLTFIRYSYDETI